MVDLKRRDGEHFLEWKFRLLESKLRKEIDLDWSEIGEMLGLNVSADHLRKTAYGIVEAKTYYEDIKKDSFELDVVAEIEEKQRELRKERVKLQDMRREVRKYERYEARMETLMEELKIHIQKLTPLFQEKPTGLISNGEREALVLFSDWHYGYDIDNQFNKYNREIARQRIKKLVNHTIKYGKEAGIETLHVANLGDIINGQIHVTTRVSSEIDAVQQTMEVAEILAEVLSELANTFKKIEFYNIVGNHGRTITKKEDSVIRDNFEYFIVWYLRERLKGFDNISITEDKDGVVVTEIKGQKIALAHGNFEKLSTPQALNDAYGVIFNYICIGHYHHTNIKEISKHTDFIVNNALCGTDEYALSLRKVSKPAQKMLIFDNDGLETIHNIRF